MQLLCNEKKQVIPLTALVENSNHSVLKIDPFVGDHLFHLEWSAPPPSSFLAFTHREQERATLPHLVRSWKEIPANTFLLLFPYEGGYLSCMTLSHLDLLSTFQGVEKGLYLSLHSGSTHEANQPRSVFLAQRGESPNQAFNNACKEALLLTGSRGKLLLDKPPVPCWLNKLGWSTRLIPPPLTQEKIIQAVQNLIAHSVPICNVLIEEGWQELSVSQKGDHLFSPLKSFDTEKARFPRGLKGLTEHLKELGVHHVGLTHHVMGASGGINASLARKYDLPPDTYGRYFLGFDLGRTFEFYHDYYSYLRKQGITFINVTHQNEIPNYSREGLDVTRLFKHLQTAIQAASSLLFDNAHFNEGCLKNENLFYWNSSRLLHPAGKMDLKTSTGFTHYIHTHLKNTLWTQHLMQSSVDSWSTYHVHSETLATFHALSGAPSLLADATSNTCTTHLKKFVLPSGHLLTSDHALTLCEEGVFIDPQKQKEVYKGYTFKGEQGILGVFNLFQSKKSVGGSISPSDVKGIKGKCFGAFSFHHGFLGLIDLKERKAIKLKPYQSDILSFSPLVNGIAFIGCHRLFIPSSPIEESHYLEDGFHFKSLIKGPFLLYSEKEALEIRCNGEVIPWDYDHEKKVLTIMSTSQIIEETSHYILSFD